MNAGVMRRRHMERKARMSIQTGVTCLDCRINAPNVGDGGFLGAPTLEVAEESAAGGLEREPLPTFEYFYEALAGLGIRPYDLDTFREFLVAHSGHRLFLSGDHDDQDDWPPELQEADEADDPDGMDAYEQREEARVRRVASGEFLEAHFHLQCSACEASLQSGEPELLRAQPDMAVPRDAAERFASRWGRYPDEGWNHRLMGIADPYEPLMEELVAFARHHAAHGMRARVVPASPGSAAYHLRRP
jgi:hypothetical protein